MSNYRSATWDQSEIRISTHRYEQTRKMIYDSGEFILFVLRDIFTMRNLIFAGLFAFCAELVFIFAMLVLIAL